MVAETGAQSPETIYLFGASRNLILGSQRYLVPGALVPWCPAAPAIADADADAYADSDANAAADADSYWNRSSAIIMPASALKYNEQGHSDFFRGASYRVS